MKMRQSAIPSLHDCVRSDAIILLRSKTVHSKESCSLEFEPSPSSFQRTLQSECKEKEKGIGNDAANLCILLSSCT